MRLFSPLIVFLIMVILYVILTPGIIINFPPIDNNWNDKSSYIATRETTLVSAIVHGLLYSIITMTIMGLVLPYSNYYAPSHMYHRYRELYGRNAANAMGKSLSNLGQAHALSAMPRYQKSMYDATIGPGYNMGPMGPRLMNGMPAQVNCGGPRAAGARHPGRI